MCLAIPGKIIKIEKDKALIDYGEQKSIAKIIDGKYSIGEYVIVQGKCIITKVSSKEAKNFLKTLKTKKDIKIKNRY